MEILAKKHHPETFGDCIPVNRHEHSSKPLGLDEPATWLSTKLNGKRRKLEKLY